MFHSVMFFGAHEYAPSYPSHHLSRIAADGLSTGVVWHSGYPYGATWSPYSTSRSLCVVLKAAVPETPLMTVFKSTFWFGLVLC